MKLYKLFFVFSCAFFLAHSLSAFYEERLEHYSRQSYTDPNQPKLFLHCGNGFTPQWRRGPDGKKSLCNACGLHFSRNIKSEKKILRADTTERIKINNLIHRR
ncbi:MAG: hypothetical protein H6731_05160 [Myxococcales bacterium]|nr:MAG: hypothetical protein H6731_05160 [Myxococcales bacterium]